MTTGQIYSVPASAYAKAYLRRRATVPGIIIAVLFLAAFIAGFDDARWWLVGLMGIFIIIPMAVSMAWFIITGRRDMAIRLRPQSIEADKETVRIHFYPFDYDGENPAPMQTVIIKTDQVAETVYGQRYLNLRLVPGCLFDFILIPSDNVPTGTIFEQ